MPKGFINFKDSSDRKNIRVGGMSFENGIVMRTEKAMGIAFIDEKGKIRTFTAPIKAPAAHYSFLAWPFIRGLALFYDVFLIRRGISQVMRKLTAGDSGEHYAFFRKLNKLYLVIIILVLVDFVFSIISRFLFYQIAFSWAYILSLIFEIALIIVASGLIMLILLGKKNLIKTFKHHGAEHQMIAAFEQTQRVDIKQSVHESRLHPRCGTNFSWFFLITVFLIFGLLPLHFGLANIPLSIIYLALSVSIGFEFFVLANWFYPTWFGKFLMAPAFIFQRLTTLMPDERDLQLAQQALRAVVS